MPHATFNNKPLFKTGPTRISPRALTLRHALQTTPGVDGVRLASQGKDGRAIEQTGHLVADTIAALQQLQNAIETQLDGTPHTLDDGLGRTWPNTLILSVEPGKIEPHLLRYRMAYRIQYIQVTP